MAVSPSALEDAWGNGGDDLMNIIRSSIMAWTIGAV